MVQIAETSKSGLTLAEKLKKKIEQLASPSNYLRPAFNQEGCIICGVARLDGDPTGLTCSNPKCLLELGARYNTTAEKLRVIAEKLLGLSPQTSPKKLDELAETIAEEISNIKSLI